MTVIEGTTLEEEGAVKELKRRLMHEVTPIMLEDESLFYRFCKARDFKVDDAETMLRKHIAWRKEFHTDSILRDYKTPEAVKYVPYSTACCDKDGCAILYIDVGNADVKGVFNAIRRIDFLKYTVQSLEKNLELQNQQNKKLGKSETKMSCILNFKNFNFLKATHKELLESIIQFAIIFQDNYPERVKRIFFINVSTYFYLGYSVVKHVLASALTQKMSFYGTDGWKEALLEQIDADNLPAFLGGNRTDPDGNPHCKTFINHGRKVDKRYFICNTEKKLSKALDTEKLTVTPLSKEERSFEVVEPGSFLEWEFETKSKDIGFLVYFKGKFADETHIELVPKQRIDTCYEPEKGLFKCEKPGKYVIVFDNSYSWINAKEIYYRARIRRPQPNAVHCN